MKKIFSISAIALFMVSMNVMSFAQNVDDKDYSAKKMQFWQMYQEYKSNLDRGIVIAKPIDPNGLFMVDENNNFGPITRPLGELNNNNNSAPWIGSKNIVAPWVWSQDTAAYVSIDGGSGTVQINAGITVDDQSF